MAEEKEDRSTEDLTDEISQHRAEEFRKKGMVAQSKEITSLLVILSTAATLYLMGTQSAHVLAELMKDVFTWDFSSRPDLAKGEMLHQVWIKALRAMAAIGLPVCIAGFFFGAIGSVVQVGSLFSTEALQPDLNRMDPLQGTKRIFSGQHFKESLRLIFKMVVVVAVAYQLLKGKVFHTTFYMVEEPRTILNAFSEVAKGIFSALLGVLAVFAAIDFGLQRWEHQKKLRMTKQEAKEEFKDREGDPQIKARVRALQREVARKRMMQAVKKADVIITNPTHIAIALAYSKDSMLAPKVVAKGADFVAQKIKAIAAEAGIPQVENVPLARTMFKTVKVGQTIPRALYEAVAQVLAYVYRLKNKRSI